MNLRCCGLFGLIAGPPLAWGCGRKGSHTAGVTVCGWGCLDGESFTARYLSLWTTTCSGSWSSMWLVLQEREGQSAMRARFLGVQTAYHHTKSPTGNQAKYGYYVVGGDFSPKRFEFSRCYEAGRGVWDQTRASVCPLNYTISDGIKIG